MKKKRSLAEARQREIRIEEEEKERRRVNGGGEGSAGDEVMRRQMQIQEDVSGVLGCIWLESFYRTM